MPVSRTPELDLEKLYDLSVDQPKMVKEASSAKLKLAEHKGRFVHAGFDMFRDTQSEYIWKLEKDPDTGEEFIIRTASIDPVYQQTNNWSAEPDAGKKAITLLYKGHAIKAFKKADLAFSEDNIEDWRRFLLDKISSDPSFLKHILQDLGDQKRKLLASKCPDLFK